MTQTPPVLKKHPGGDRTGDHVPRSKMTAENARIINEGLHNYELEVIQNNVHVSLWCFCYARKKVFFRFVFLDVCFLSFVGDCRFVCVCMCVYAYVCVCMCVCLCKFVKRFGVGVKYEISNNN